MDPAGTINSEHEPMIPQSDNNQPADPLNAISRTVVDNIVTFDVGGRIFRTHRSTLSRHPETLLGNTNRLQPLCVPDRPGEYFIDRNALAFESVLDYFRNDRLERPDSVPVQNFVRDLLFYDLGLDVVVQYLKSEDLLDEPNTLPDPKNKIQLYLYKLLNEPASSIAATALSIFDLLMVVLAIVALCIQSIPQTGIETDSSANVTGDNGTHWTTPFLEIEIVTNIWFIAELFIRFVVDPSKLIFFLRCMSIVDVLSILPFFIDVLPSLATQNWTNYASFLLSFRVLRIFRMFKVSRLSSLNGLTVLGQTFAHAKREVAMLLIFFLSGMLFFGAAIYYAEQGYPDTNYVSVPDAFWWSVITWTTIGYGDMVPKTPSGKAVACAAAVSGVVVVGLAIPPIVERYQHFFDLARKMEELKAVYREYRIFQYKDDLPKSKDST